MKNSQSPIGIVNVVTKSNFRNLNYVDLPLLEMYGQRVTALVYDEQIGKMIQVDFILSEVKNIYTTKIDVQYAKDLIDGYLSPKVEVIEEKQLPKSSQELTKELYVSKMKDINEERYGCYTNSCVCCGKPMKAGEVLWVHMNENWLAVNPTIVNEDNCLELTGFNSQGCFPIGNSCANKMKGFTFTMELSNRGEYNF